MIDFDTVWALFKVDPVACSILFVIYLNTRTYGKRILNLELRVTNIEGNKNELHSTA